MSLHEDVLQNGVNSNNPQPIREHQTKAKDSAGHQILVPAS
jgi:hypothetical protein